MNVKIVFLLIVGVALFVRNAQSCSLSEDFIKIQTRSYSSDYISCPDNKYYDRTPGPTQGDYDRLQDFYDGIPTNDQGYVGDGTGSSNPENQAEQLKNIINILDAINSSNEEARIREQEASQRKNAELQESALRREAERQKEIDRLDAERKIIEEQGRKNSKTQLTKIQSEKSNINNDDWKARASQHATSSEPKGKAYIETVNRYVKFELDSQVRDDGVTLHYLIRNSSNKELQVHWCEQKNCTTPNESATVRPGGTEKAVMFTKLDGTEITYWACVTNYDGNMVMFDNGKKDGRVGCWYIKK